MEEDLIPTYDQTRPIIFVHRRHSEFKVIYIPWQSSYSVIGNVFYCSIWHLLTPFLKNLHMKVGHSVYQEQNQIKTIFWKNDQAGSSVFSISKGSFKIKHNSSSHDSFATKRD